MRTCPGSIQERPSPLLIHLEDDLLDLVDQPPALLFAPLQRLVPGAIRAEGEGLPLRDAGVDQPAQGHLQHDEERNRGECDDGGPARGVRELAASQAYRIATPATIADATNTAAPRPSARLGTTEGYARPMPRATMAAH